MSLKFSSIPQKRLVQGITSASSTFYVNNILSFDGITDVTPADLGTQHYVAFRNDTGTIVEFMEIDPATISTGPITIVRRGLSYYGDLTTEDADLKLDWPSNSIVMFGTDVPQIFQWLKEYIDAAAIAGAVPASTSAAGIVVEGSQAEVDAGTATKVVSGTAYKLFAPLDKRRGRAYNDYAVDSVGTDAYAITITPAIIAYAAGQVFTFKAGTANTGAATLNVSGLGAKTIKKAVSSDLEDGDIIANQIVIVEYDGTNFQLLSSQSKNNAQIFTTQATSLGAPDTRFDVTNPAGTTFRYTYDGTGTDPGITSVTVPVGCIVQLIGPVFTYENTGIFIVTNSGSNFFEVTNPFGVVESDKTLANGGGLYVSTQTWTKPSGVKFVKVVTIGAGAGGGSGNTRAAGLERNGGGGGGGGAYTEKTFLASTIDSSIPILVGKAGAGGTTSVNGYIGGASSFGNLISAYGGGPGSGNTTTQVTGGSGGGTAGNGLFGNSSSVNGGLPNAGTGVGIAGGGAGALTSGAQYAEYGGASGGIMDGTGGGGNNTVGGSSLYGGGGGGGGAGVTAASPGTEAVGKAGGRSGTLTLGGGGTGGAINGGPGGNGTSRSGFGCGDGGGGGGGDNNGTAGNGGIGGSPGGGGGGGGGGTNDSGGLAGDGGAGGRGEVIVYTW